MAQAKAVSAGDLRDRLTWYAPVRTKNSHGQLAVAYPTAATPERVAAKVEVAEGGEADRHAQQTPLVTYDVTVRRATVDGLAHDWEADWLNRGRRLRAVAVLPHPNGGQYLLVRCVERPSSTAA